MLLLQLYLGSFEFTIEQYPLPLSFTPIVMVKTALLLGDGSVPHLDVNKILVLLLTSTFSYKSYYFLCLHGYESLEWALMNIHRTSTSSTVPHYLSVSWQA
jgi:hypothetical protein